MAAFNWTLFNAALSARNESSAGTATVERAPPAESRQECLDDARMRRKYAQGRNTKTSYGRWQKEFE